MSLTGQGVDGDGLLSKLLDQFYWLDMHKLSRVSRLLLLQIQMT